MSDTDIEHITFWQAKRPRGRPVGTTKKTPSEVSQTQREASSRWYYKNHEYRCTQKKKYYEENRDRILEQRKEKKHVLFNINIFY